MYRQVSAKKLFDNQKDVICDMKELTLPVSTQFSIFSFVSSFVWLMCMFYSGVLEYKMGEEKRLNGRGMLRCKLSLSHPEWSADSWQEFQYSCKLKLNLCVKIWQHNCIKAEEHKTTNINYLNLKNWFCILQVKKQKSFRLEKGSNIS